MLALTALVFTSAWGGESNDARYFALVPGATWTYEFRYWEEGRFEDCIAIVDALESESSKYEMSGRREYCAGVGMVRHRTMAIHEYGVSNGEYTLLEFIP